MLPTRSRWADGIIANKGAKLIARFCETVCCMILRYIPPVWEFVPSLCWRTLRNHWHLIGFVTSSLTPCSSRVNREIFMECLPCTVSLWCNRMRWHDRSSEFPRLCLLGFLLNSPRLVDRVMVLTFVYSGYEDWFIQSSSDVWGRGISMCPRGDIFA